MPGYVPPHLRNRGGGGDGGSNGGGRMDGGGRMGGGRMIGSDDGGNRMGGGSWAGGGRMGGGGGVSGRKGGVGSSGGGGGYGEPQRGGGGGFGHRGGEGSGEGSGRSLSSFDNDGLKDHQLAAIRAREAGGGAIAAMLPSQTKRDWSANRPAEPAAAIPGGDAVGGGGGGAGSGACFNCGEGGHKSRDCPAPKSGGGRRGGDSAQGGRSMKASIGPGGRREKPGGDWANIYAGGSTAHRIDACQCDCEPGEEHVPVYVHVQPNEDGTASRRKLVEHTVRASDCTPDNGRALLGRHGQFCATFFHMFPVWEAEVMENTCLDPTQVSTPPI